MSFLEGLHGTIAAVVLCGLLLIDEAGVPLPIAPSEVLLLVAGLLIASEALSEWIFLPAAAITMAMGMVAGYSWARAVGQSGLSAVAERVGASAAYERARARLASADPVGIALARMVPGVRPYATLLSGAARIDVRTFLFGAIPALVAWELLWIALGMLVGLPVVHFLGRFEKLAFRGALLVVLGAIAYLGLRRAASAPVPTGWCPPHGSRLLAAVIDSGIVASVVVGFLAIGRHLIRASTNGWIDLVVVAVVVICYLFIRPEKPNWTASGMLWRQG